MAQQRLAVTVIPGAGWRAGDIRTVAQEAEDAGFDAIFNTEVNSDTMTTAHVMGCATSRIRVGTWIANIYLRHSYVCAKGAGLIADDTNGRFTLGLGVSHQPVNTALGIDMSAAPRDLHRYVVEVRDWLKGRGPTTSPAPAASAGGGPPLRRNAQPSRHRTRSRGRGRCHAHDVVARAGTTQPDRDRTGAVADSELGPLDLTLGLPTFLGEDLHAQREIARGNLGLYTSFPYFQRMWRESGFSAEADAMAGGAGPAALTDALLDSFCLIGPLSRCRERLVEYRQAGVDLPILNPPVDPKAAITVIRVFAGEGSGAAHSRAVSPNES
jgi:alkanesulfonate monooxygenase SsuD/methylene tetrahydromethanopterin reductase-like flavin-dependent oxidoreductase (luciferase family)